jgi:hypothetical protein
MMKVHGEIVEVRSHQCAYCDKRFKYPNKKRLHEMTHTGEKPNVCQLCAMGFFKKSRLRSHLAKQHGISEEELNTNSSYLQSPTSTVLIGQGTVLQQHKSEDSLLNGSDEDLYCQYCQKPFGNRADLLLHERQEAMEFEQLHEMFEDSEFSGLVEVSTGGGAGGHHGGASQTDIIQNALLTAGIENGLGSPGGVVTDSDSVVTISEADIDSFSIGFIPDASWTSEVSTNLTSSSSLVTTTIAGGDHFHHPQLQPLELNISRGSGSGSSGGEEDDDDDDDGSTSSIHVTTASHADLQAALQAGTTIYTTSSDTFANIKTEPMSSLGDMSQMWETTVALSGVPTTTLSSIIKSEPNLLNSSGDTISSSSANTVTMQGDIFTSTANGLNGIYTETFTIPSSLGGGGSEGGPLNAQIISIAGQTATIINGTEIDFSKLTAAGGTFTISAQQLLDQETLTFQAAPPPVRPTIIQWQDDPSLPAGWKTRQHFRDGQANKMDTYFLAPDGTQFRSKWKVVEFMESSGSYCQTEIDWVKSSISTARPDSCMVGSSGNSAAAAAAAAAKERSDKLRREWKDDDPTVPAGWKVAWTTTSDNRAKIAFMSPDKKIFHSRKSALQHMVTEGTYASEDIVKMTKGLNVLLNVGDEWKEGNRGNY